jgi:hypothetical protein
LSSYLKNIRELLVGVLCGSQNGKLVTILFELLSRFHQLGGVRYFHCGNVLFPKQSEEHLSAMVFPCFPPFLFTYLNIA